VNQGQAVLLSQEHFYQRGTFAGSGISQNTDAEAFTSRLWLEDNFDRLLKISENNASARTASARTRRRQRRFFAVASLTWCSCSCQAHMGSRWRGRRRIAIPQVLQ